MINITFLLSGRDRFPNHRMSSQFSIILVLAILVHSGFIFAQDIQVKKDNSKPINVKRVMTISGVITDNNPIAEYT